jgi:vitamin K-dependent gamma-carboxylase
MAISERIHRPVDVASLAAFRIGFGALLLVLALRYFAHGWIAEYFLIPRHFFKYWGFAWVTAWPGIGMYVHFAVLALCALGVLLGYRYRLCIVGYGLLLAYAHLIDKTNYLNHYYLVLCVCGLMACLPLHGAWSWDARRDPRLCLTQVPAWMLWALRAQFGMVWMFGGIAKLNGDWLLHAEPLATWLGRTTEVPVLGAIIGARFTAFAMSWAGALFDLSIAALLLGRRTRSFAFAAALLFHLSTAWLFAIGMFPYLMLCGATLFLAPEWPRKVLARLGGSAAVGERSATATAMAMAVRGWALPVFALYFVAQVLIPLRHWLYPGQVCWTEQGFRFSWNVMLMEKNGSVDFRIVEPSTGRVFHASPRDYFTPYQIAMMAPQPDMLLEAARIVAADFRSRGVSEPAVYADAFASLNGRPMQRLLDPMVDLAREADGLSNKTWILPMLPEPKSPAAALARSFE